jgi:DNA-binding transcriptional LysR family regulator
MPINLNALRVFVAVATHRGFTKAAGVLHLSQPAVSKAVQVLETEVGMPLFERGAGPLRVTHAGVTLLDRAHELFAVERSAEEELRALRGLERGVLRVGASTTIATYMLPSILGTFRALHPGVAMHVESGNTRTIARTLARRRLDVALVEGPVPDNRFVSVPWRNDELVVIAPPDHALTKHHTRVSPSRLVQHDFVYREPGSGTRDVADAVLHEHGLTPRIALTLDSTEAVKQAVAAGLGLAVVSRAAASDQLALGTVKEIRLAGLHFPRQLTILQLAGRRSNLPAVAFEKLLREYPV